MAEALQPDSAAGSRKDRKRGETRHGQSAFDGMESRFPLATPPAQRGPVERFLRSPLLWLAAYYSILLLTAAALIRFFPQVRAAVMAPSFPAVAEGAALLTGSALPGAQNSAQPVADIAERALTTFFVVFGAVLIAIPVAWVYMWTKRLRYDPGLVRSVIILPIAVAGILLVVKNSLAIAFSLAGIVAAVRFRNTLKDPQDAVYVFLTIAIGIAAGVQALDVALVVSASFNVAVLAMWKFQVGSVYGGRYGRTGVLSIGDSSILVAQTPEACRLLRRQVFERADDMDADGVLLVHSTDAELARNTVQDALTLTARDWRLLGVFPRGEEVSTAEYLVRLAKETTPADLLGNLDEWSALIVAAEYIPYRQRERPRPKGEDAEST